MERLKASQGQKSDLLVGGEDRDGRGKHQNKHHRKVSRHAGDKSELIENCKDEEAK